MNSNERGPDLQPCGAHEHRGALAACPVADLVMVLQVSDEAIAIDPERAAAVDALAVARIASSVDVGLREGPGEVFNAPEVRVIAGALAGQ
jgi:hypothetical protein